jgi:hypothetical protein
LSRLLLSLCPGPTTSSDKRRIQMAEFARRAEPRADQILT